MFLFGKYSARQHHRTLGSDDRCRQFGGAGKVLVDRGSAGATFGDGPHDEALATSGVTAGEDTRNTGPEAVVAHDVAALIHRYAELVDHRQLVETGAQRLELRRRNELVDVVHGFQNFGKLVLVTIIQVLSSFYDRIIIVAEVALLLDLQLHDRTIKEAERVARFMAAARAARGE